ncbi:BGTF surface domain-containing protein [Halobaculum magnesiiphilum]|uniref:Surface glycoprotein n=1 Tax=Halobaculum magnesiiphilum TaxID=1017351 RepID=A0A8T8WGX9_9EURY|nr:BGTF surface domain-containing protein [Halobaculum magnesiiphilum]QZP39098.1 surface glycoprotein [Halobaculum magnesiiphilum]
MTETNNKIRALFLTALMVFSVFAGTVAFTGTAAAANATLSGVDSSVQAGNDITFDASAANADNITVWIDENEDNALNSSEVNDTFTGASVTDGTLTVPSDLPEGDYVLAAAENTSSPTTADDTFTFTVDNSGPSVNSVVHYDNDTSSGEDGELEIAFSENISSGTITLYDEDGSVVDTPYSVSGNMNNGQFLVDVAGDVNPRVDVVNIDVEDSAGNAISDNFSVTFASTTIKNVTNNDATAFEGSTVAVVDSTGLDSSVEVTGPNDFFFSGTTGTNSQVYTFDTGDRDLGDYNVTFSSGPDQILTLRNLGLDASVDEENITVEEALTGEISANNGNRDVDVDVLDSDDDVVAEDTVTLDGSGNGAFDAGTLEDTGDYTVEVTDVATGVTVTAGNVTVNEAEEGEAALSEGTVTVTQGDNAQFTVEFSGGATEGTVLIGDIEEDGYQANVTVTEDSDDDQVTFTFNTYTAGGAGTTVSLAGDSVGTDDEVTLTNDGDADYEQLSDILDTGDYIVSTSTGDAVATADSPDEVGTLIIEQREAPSQQLWRTSDTTLEAVADAIDDEDEDEVAAITSAVENDQVTQTDTVAIDPDGSMDDILVHQVTAPGLEGLLDDVSADGDSTTEALYQATQETNDYGQPAVEILFEETNPGSNAEATSLNVSTLTASEATSALTVVYDDSSSNYYVFVDTAALEDAGFEDGDNVETDINVQSDRLLDIDDDVDAEGAEDEYQTAAANFSVEEADGSFDVNEDDEVEAVAGNASITGTTNVAPGTEFTVRVQSTEETQPRFIETQTVTVQADGTFEATFNLNDNAAGDTFTASVRQAGFSASADGVLVESVSTPTATPDDGTPTDTATPDDGTPTATATPDEGTPTATATPDEGTPTATQTSTSTPGFGAVLAVIALIGAALLAVRRDN